MRVEGSHGSNLELVEGWSLSGSENVPVVCKEGLSSLPEHLNLGNHFFERCCLTQVEVRGVVGKYRRRKYGDRDQENGGDGRFTRTREFFAFWAEDQL